MSSGVEGLRLFQWGKETTRGTAVAATSKIAVPFIDFEPTDRVDRPKLAKGLAHRNPASETQVMRGTRFTVPEAPVVLRQTQHWLGMSVATVPSATGVGPYTWTFTRSLTADPAPTTRTIERRLTDGSNSIDNEWAYCLLSRISFHYRRDETLKFSAEGFARRVQASTLTAAQALPTIEIPVTPLAKVWIDSAWASLGTTQITGQVQKADLTFHTGLKPWSGFDGRTDLDFSKYVLDADEVGMDLELELLVETSSGQYATEKTAAEAGTLRAIRLEVDEGTNTLELDGLYKHEAGSVFKVGSQDGQDIVGMRLVDSDDGTNLFKALLTNAINTDT